MCLGNDRVLKPLSWARVYFGARFPLTSQRRIHRHEANISTQQPQAQQEARIPSQDGNERRSERAASQKATGTPQDQCLRGPSRRRFDEIYRDGDRANGDFLRLLALPGTGLVGIAVTRSLGCNARRNLFRRRMREIARISGGQPSADLVVLVKAGANGQTFQALSDEFRQLVAEVVARWDENLDPS